MNEKENDRRRFLKMSALAGSALLVGACGTGAANSGNSAKTDAAKKSEPGKKDEKEVTPLEDLMREHGVLRRALFVFSEAAVILPSNPPAVWADAIQKAAKLFRTFGEDYHEKKLEEQYIFPLIRQKGVGGPASLYPDDLTQQHNRGREITDYMISVTAAGKIGSNAMELSKVLHGFVRMYDAHAAREDTIVFPAWKDLLTADEYDELGDKFENIEHEQFGEDGYENAVKQIAEIEASVGLADISKLTPPSPPMPK
jgi:hemerythrin-like domain-containing protein